MQRRDPSAREFAEMHDVEGSAMDPNPKELVALETVVMRYDSRTEDWLPTWCCGMCFQPLMRDARVVWQPREDGQPAPLVLLCGQACEDSLRDVDAKRIWHKMTLARFLVCSVALTDTQDGVVELFEKLALNRFNAAANDPPQQEKGQN